MKNYIIKNINSKFGYDFVQRDDNGTETLRMEITSKTTDGYLRLPKGITVNGRTLCKISHIGDAEEFNMDSLGEKAIRTSTGTSTKVTHKIDLTEYYTDEEKTQIAELQAQIDKINEAAKARAQKDIKKNELKTALAALDLDTLKAIMAEINGVEA